MGFWSVVIVGVLSIAGWISISYFQSTSEEYDSRKKS